MENIPGNQLQGGPPIPQQQQQQLHPEMNSGQHPSMPSLAEGAQQVKVISHGTESSFRPAIDAAEAGTSCFSQAYSSRRCECCQKGNCR